MSFENKYRVHEVAKDFKVNGKAVGSKKVMEILTKYAETPSSHMAVLSDRELSIVFDYLTQNNQIKDLEEVFSETYHEPKQSGGKEKENPAKGGQREKTQNNAGGREKKPAGDRKNGARGRNNAPAKGSQKEKAPAPAQKGEQAAAKPTSGYPRRRWSTPAAAWM